MAEEIINPNYKINPTNVEINPLKTVEDDIKVKAQPTLDWNTNRRIEQASSSNFFAPFVDNRIKTKDFTIDPREVYTELSSGEMVSRYPNFIRGIDNEERFAQNQTAGEKWVNGATKFLGKTTSAIVGGTAGTIYGIGSWISDGSFQSVYNNDFSNWLADLDVKMDNNFANYYTKQEQDKNLFGQMGTANFWSDKVLGGLSFTAGAIVSEGIWAWATGGASLATAGARWGARSLGMQRVAKALSKTKDLIKSPYRNTLQTSGAVSDIVLGGNLGGRLGATANTLRFTMTSAGYESSVEALQFRREQEENFLYNFQQVNGRNPNAEETAEFKANLESAANAVFTTNMAIVGSSNLATLGNVFKIKSPLNTGLKESINRSVYGVGKQTTDLSKLQKVNRFALPYVKNAITEGLYEEGSQSMTSNVASKWLEHTYNEKKVGESFDMSGAIYEAMSHQYGTKEGWVENGVGMIIGILGEVGTRNSKSDLKKAIQTAEQRQNIQKTYTPQALSQIFLNASRVSSFNAQAETAEKEGNVTEARIAQDGAVVSYLTNRYELGDTSKEILADVSASLETVTQEDLDSMGVTQDLSSWKQQQLEAFTQVSSMFSSTREFAERIVGQGQVMGLDTLKESNELSALGDINMQELTIQAVTFSLMAGHRADSIMKEASQAMTEMFGDKGRVLDVVSGLSKVKTSTRGTINLLTNHIKNYRAQHAKLNEELREASTIAENQTGDVNKGNKILEISQKIATLQGKISEAEQKLQTITDNLNIADSANKDIQSNIFSTPTDINTLTIEDLINLDENINSLTNSVNELSSVNSEVAERAKAILTEYKNAKNAWKVHKQTVDMLVRGKVNLPNVNTRLGRILKKGAKLDDANQEWLSELLSDFARMRVDILADSTAEAPTQESVTESVRQGGVESLSKEEKDVYEQNKEAIDTNIKQEAAPPVTTTIPTTKTDIDYIEDRYNEVINNLGTFTEHLEDQDTPKPTKSEIEEFNNLYNKQLTEGLTGEETLRFEALAQQLGEWRVYGSFIDKGSGMTLADLIELKNQLEQKQEVEDTKTDLTIKDVESVTTNLDEFGKKDDHSLGQNTLASVTIRKDKTTGLVTIHHLNPLSVVGGVYSVERGGKTLNNPTNIEIGDVVTTESGVVFKLVAGRNLEFQNQEDVNRLGFEIVNAGIDSWSYSDVYEDNGSEIVKVASQLEEPNLNPQHAFNVSEGQEVTFEIDRNDSYTKKLLEDYNKAKTDKAKEESLKALQDGIKIYIVVDGVKVNTLKAQRGVSDENVTALRQEATKVALQDDFTNSVGAKTTVQNVFLGSPQLLLSKNDAGQVVLAPKPITSTAVDNIITKGYIMNGELTLSEETSESVNKMYVSKMSKDKNNEDVKIPIVVVKRGVNYIALPIKMVRVGLDNSTIDSEISMVLNSESEVEMAKNINAVIGKYSLAMDKVVPNKVTEDTITELENALREYSTSVSAETLADPNYKKVNLQTDSEMYVNIDNLNVAISDAKLRIDIQNLQFTESESVQNMNKEGIEAGIDSATEEIKNRLDNASVSETEPLEDFLQPFNDEMYVVGESVPTQTKYEVLKEMFGKELTNAEKRIFGNELVGRAQAYVAAYENILKQVNVDKNIKNSGKNNSDCKK